MAKLNWARQRQRNLIARQGIELAMAVAPFFAPLTARGGRPLPPSKAGRRAQATEAAAGYQGTISRAPVGFAAASSRTVTVRCVCGHTANAAVPPDVERPHFRCSRCGTRQVAGTR
jgi:hypothetical protein